MSEKIKIIQVKSETRLRKGYGGQVGVIPAFAKATAGKSV